MIVVDFRKFSEFVNIGGYIVFDDYLDHKYSPEVRSAVDDIVNKMLDNKYEIIGSLPNYQNSYCAYEIPGLNQYINLALRGAARQPYHSELLRVFERRDLNPFDTSFFLFIVLNYE